MYKKLNFSSQHESVLFVVFLSMLNLIRLLWNSQVNNENKKMPRLRSLNYQA